MPRRQNASRRLVADGRTYLWNQRHRHRVPDGSGGVRCSQLLTLSPQPSGSGGPLRIVFDGGPGRIVADGFTSGSGDVGLVHGAHLNLHTPGAVRALLDVALARGWDPDVRGEVRVDGWSLLEEAAAAYAERQADAGGDGGD